MKNLIVILLLLLTLFKNINVQSTPNKITIIDIKGHELLFLLNVNDGKFNELYALQYQNQNFDFLVSHNNFKLISSNKNEIVISSESSIFHFTKNELSNAYNGYGIYHMTNDFTLNIVANGNFDDLIKVPKLMNAPSTQSMTCTSGGVGANECSISSGTALSTVSCSVSCKDGYYACCDDNIGKCKCIKSGTNLNTNPSLQSYPIHIYE